MVRLEPVDGGRDDKRVCGIDIDITEVEKAIEDLTLDVSEEDDDSEGLGDDDDDSEGRGHDDNELVDDDDVEGLYGSYSDGSWKPGIEDAEDEHDVRRKRPLDEQMAVRDYNIALGRPIKMKLNDSSRCKFACVEGCPWKWDISGIPCKHAVACMMMNDSDLEKFVHFYYSKETWQRIYEPDIRPIIGEDHWEKQTLDLILPPKYSRAGGRPKMKRTKGNDIPQDPYKAKRKYRKIICGKCGQPGHNRRICKGTTVKDKGNKKVPDASTSSVANDPMMKKRRRECASIVGASISNVPKWRKGAEKAAETDAPLGSNAQMHKRKRAMTTSGSTAIEIQQSGPQSSLSQKKCRKKCT
ncbi:hypothetical protein CRG98_019455 [Punica granatum]|uniref:CCHC-type domain-containing protein n=1 Tax=Punica granatum TaxID=22663 RepID=A0A2I0JV11_PUNGR|nr:hypothetical protein CRG98_019455 [Punica granatum]